MDKPTTKAALPAGSGSSTVESGSSTPNVVPGATAGIIGLVLAAGQGTRFDPSGRLNKLMQPLPGGMRVVDQTIARVRAGVDAVVAVVGALDSPVAQHLQQLQVPVVLCAQARQGMGHSVAAGVAATQAETGWIIALADMPFVACETVQALAAALRAGAPCAVPFFKGVRGNPVAFQAAWRSTLLSLTGDQGARHLLQQPGVVRLNVPDPGVLRDVDTPADLVGVEIRCRAGSWPVPRPDPGAG